MRITIATSVWIISALAAILTLFAFWMVILPGMIAVDGILYLLGFIVSILIISGIVITALDDEKGMTDKDEEIKTYKMSEFNQAEIIIVDENGKKITLSEFIEKSKPSKTY